MKPKSVNRSSLSRLLLTAAIVTTSFSMHANAATRDSVVGAYFEEWSIYGADYNISDIQASGAADKLTHIFYAFANVDATGHCAIADAWADYQTPYLPSVNGQAYTGPVYGNFAALQQLKALHPNLKVLMSIGGASATNTADFSAAAASPTGRATLVSSCVDMFINGNVAAGVSVAGLFDGIDLDWEFPTAADTGNFTALVKDFRNQLRAAGEKSKKHYLLTIAAPAGSQNFSNIQLHAVGEQIDFFNLETYDYHGTWETTTNFAAPLHESPYDPALGQGFTVEGTVQAYLKAGVPPEKLVLGIPAYGRGWTGVPATSFGLYQTSSGPAPSPAGDTLATDGVATYRTLKDFTADGFKLHYCGFSFADWLYNPSTKTFWTFDDAPTVVVKMIFADTYDGGLGGAFEWAIKDDDANATLVKTMALGLHPHQ